MSSVSHSRGYPAVILLDKGGGDIKYAECTDLFGANDAPSLIAWFSKEHDPLKTKAYEAGTTSSPKGSSLLPLVSPQKGGARCRSDAPLSVN